MRRVIFSVEEREYIRNSLLEMVKIDLIKKSDFSHIIKHIRRNLGSSTRIAIRRLKNITEKK